MAARREDERSELKKTPIKSHSLRKDNQLVIRLLAGEGVEGDVHSGTTVKHRSRVARTPGAPNLRQVHLFHSELLDELQKLGFAVGPATLARDAHGRLVRKAGVMSVVLSGGEVRPLDQIRIERPAQPYRPLEPV